MYELQKNEPELIYGNAVGPKPHYVQVFRVDGDRVTYASQSRSGMVFCLEVVERNVDGLKAGHYWASGPAEADDPCGEDATWGTDPAGNETEGGLPDSPKSDDPEEPGLPDAPDINQDTDPGEDEGEPEAPEVPQEATDPSVPDPPAIIDIDDPNQPFGGAGVISYLNMTLSSNASITGSVATNGYIQLNANAHICGDVQVAPGETVYTQANAGLTCGGEIYNGTIQLPAPGVPPSKTDNGSLPSSGSGKGKGNSGPDFDPSTRSLTIGSNNDLTLTGDTYVLCSADLSSNAKIYVNNPGGHVRIYFDSPENCPGSPTKQLVLSSNTFIGPAPGANKPASVALIFLGSPTIRTEVELRSNTSIDEACESAFIVYAPRTDVELRSNSSFCGAIAARQLTMNSNTSVDASHAGIPDWRLLVD